jgi:hypothetical protein
MDYYTNMISCILMSFHLVVLSYLEIYIYIYLLITVPIGTRTEEVYNMIPESEPSTDRNESQESDPCQSGVRYRLTQDGKQIRTKWPLRKGVQPETEKSQLQDSLVEETGNGCTKKRPQTTSKRQRTGLWIWTCLCHQKIVGYHVIKKSEGLRDATSTLYRFLEDAPDNIFIDFACGMEEKAMNWLPAYFKSARFYHDLFHATNHICGPAFSCRNNDALEGVNTSIMEQVILLLHENT